MSATESTEFDVLESILPRFKAEGFEVFVHPSPSILPPFMHAYRPDAIALSRDKKIAIEVVRPNPNSETKIKGLQDLIAQHSDWELRVFYVSPGASQKALEIASRSSIDAAIQTVLELKKNDHNLPALIIAWATLEAIGRALLPEKFRRPQTPGRLIEVLASEGFLTPSEADTLRPAISLRNATVHGGLDSAVDEKLLDDFIAILRTLADFVH